ncbi:hypothetical protein [Paraburkholderia lycopersici]|uniref:Uncharacterized protein n=1 Tax=Paraburkholderia lycopersici TaxID=416944 RepID=A0A1G7BM16_9BURK|nr:hypothetical protein [Paraburkholderia lycopersici]SDE27967.1 hypothetical protein SAMN05421548_14017 [Paraburkholderia lycopersici]
MRDDRDFVAVLDKDIFDRFDAKTLAHFDEVERDDSTITRMPVQTVYGPVIYDFRRRPPLVQRPNVRMTVTRVYWQPEEVVMQSPEGSRLQLLSGKGRQVRLPPRRTVTYPHFHATPPGG